MGAAASMKLIYGDALSWFNEYFTGMTYAEDFRSLDINGDGSISFDELRTWLKLKAHENSSWRLVVTNSSVFKAAHMFACLYTVPAQAALPDQERIFGVEAFKQFLIHLFVLSIIFVHFKHADAWKEGNDAGNNCLNLEEFKMACRTFVSAQANETLTEEKIMEDFRTLDADGSGAIDFLEVCTYCSKFADPLFASQFMTNASPANAHLSFSAPVSESEVETSTRTRHSEALHVVDGQEIVRGGHDQALDAVAQEMQKNENIAQFEEIKVATEITLGLV